MSVFDGFFTDEVLEERRKKHAGKSNSDIRTEQQIKILDQLRTDFCAVTRYWSDVPEDHYASTAYKSYCEDFQAAMARPVMQLKCQSAYETRRLKALVEEVELSKK